MIAEPQSEDCETQDKGIITLDKLMPEEIESSSFRVLATRAYNITPEYAVFATYALKGAPENLKRTLIIHGRFICEYDLREGKETREKVEVRHIEANEVEKVIGYFRNRGFKGKIEMTFFQFEKQK